MARKAERIQLLQMSSRHALSDNQFWQDFEFAASKDPDVICATETNNPRGSLNRAREFGYRPVVYQPNRETTLYLANKRKLVKHGAVPAGSWASGQRVRHVVWVSFRANGRLVFVHGAHWVNSTTNAGHVDPAKRRLFKAHQHTTKVMVQTVKKHGTGTRASFFMGDINVSEVADNKENNPNLPNHVFRSNQMLTIYDEKGVVPSEGGTFGSAIYDVIGVYKKDKSVTGVRYNIWPKQHSDHRPVSAWYDLRDVQPGSTTGTPAAPTSPDHDFLTGGNVDWSEYEDNSIYPMPIAVDDSDDLDHG